ncbi:MAG: hypothetical protein ABRQ37_01170 [Candidatus Eremiobacterota bacterium]
MCKIRAITCPAKSVHGKTCRLLYKVMPAGRRNFFMITSPACPKMTGDVTVYVIYRKDNSR